MKQIVIGIFQLGHQNVQLIAMPDDCGGEFYFVPDNESLPRIKVGLHHKIWDECVAVLLHEALEFSFCQQGLRYQHTGKINGDTSDYIFVLDHAHFGRACSSASMLVTSALPKLATLWKKHHPK